MGKLNVSYSGDETHASVQRGEFPPTFHFYKFNFCWPFFEIPPGPGPGPDRIWFSHSRARPEPGPSRVLACSSDARLFLWCYPVPLMRACSSDARIRSIYGSALARQSPERHGFGLLPCERSAWAIGARPVLKEPLNLGSPVFRFSIGQPHREWGSFYMYLLLLMSSIYFDVFQGFSRIWMYFRGFGMYFDIF